MSTADTIKELDDVLGWLDDAEAYHRAQLESVKRDREAVRRARLLHLQRQADASAGESDGIGAHSHISPGDIAHCASMKEAYTEIACRSGGLLKCAEAGRLILAAGLSKSKSVHLVSSDLRRRLSADASWEHRGPGVFRYLPYAEGGRGKGPGPSSTARARPSPRFGGGDRPIEQICT